MDHPVQITRTVDDIAESALVAMEATGALARAVTVNRRIAVLVGALITAAAVAAVGEVAFAVLMVPAVAALLVHQIRRAPVWVESAYRRRISKQTGDQLSACTGVRTLWITDAGLSDTGSGISTTIAWDRLTHHVVTPSRHVFCLGLAAVIDIPRRGNVVAVDDFAAHAAARMRAARPALA